MQPPSAASSVRDDTTEADSFKTPLATPAATPTALSQEEISEKELGVDSQVAGTGHTTPKATELNSVNGAAPNGDAQDHKATELSSDTTSDATSTEKEKVVHHNVEKDAVTQEHTGAATTAILVAPGPHDPVGAAQTEGLVEGGEKAGLEDAEDDVEDESVYPTGFPLTILTVGLFLATFVIALDNTIIGMYL